MSATSQVACTDERVGFFFDELVQRKEAFRDLLESWKMVDCTNMRIAARPLSLHCQQRPGQGKLDLPR